MASDALKYPHSSLWPTKDQYLWLLRTEASHRGLLFNSNEIDILPSNFTCTEEYKFYDGDLPSNQWLDVSNLRKPETSLDKRQDRQEVFAKITDSKERQALIKTYAWLYLEGIIKNIEERLLEAGAPKSLTSYPEEAVIHDLGTLWASTVAKAQKKDKPEARIGIFSDIPQESTTIEYIYLPFDLTFAQFKMQAARQGIVRHLTKKHVPALAKTIFLDDEIAYHQPYPTAIDESDPSLPAEIYSTTCDYEANDNGWHAHVALLDPSSMFNQQRDWRPINTEDDWRSLLRLLQTPKRKAFMRHKSVEDRMDFIKWHREREEMEIAKTGGCYTNLFLRRHMDGFSQNDEMEGMDFLKS
jgi:hypothetical protein